MAGKEYMKLLYGVSTRIKKLEMRLILEDLGRRIQEQDVSGIDACFFLAANLGRQALGQGLSGWAAGRVF